MQVSNSFPFKALQVGSGLSVLKLLLHVLKQHSLHCGSHGPRLFAHLLANLGPILLFPLPPTILKEIKVKKKVGVEVGLGVVGG